MRAFAAALASASEKYTCVRLVAPSTLPAVNVSRFPAFRLCQFKSVEDADTRVGKTIIAWNPTANALLVGVEADHDPDLKRPGVSYSRLVAQLSSAGFTEAVFCDGSDSSMLWHRGKIIIAPGEAKANMINLCIGFTQVTDSAQNHQKPKR